MWPSESHSLPSSPYIFTCECSLQWVIHLVQASGFCYTIDTGLSLGLPLDILLYPVSWRSCSFGSAGAAPSCAPADHRWGGCWGWPTHHPRLWARVVADWSVHQLSLTLTTQASSPSLPPTSSPNVADNEERGQFCFHTFWSVSLSPTPPGPALRFHPGEVQNQLSGLLHLVRGRASLSILMPPRLALLPVAGGKEWDWGILFLLLPHVVLACAAARGHVCVCDSAVVSVCVDVWLLVPRRAVRIGL